MKLTEEQREWVTWSTLLAPIGILLAGIVWVCWKLVNWLPFPSYE